MMQPTRVNEEEKKKKEKTWHSMHTLTCADQLLKGEKKPRRNKKEKKEDGEEEKKKKKSSTSIRHLVRLVVHSLGEEGAARDQAQGLAHLGAIEAAFLLELVHQEIVLVHQVAPGGKVGARVVPGGGAAVVVHEIRAPKAVLHWQVGRQREGEKRVSEGA